MSAGPAAAAGPPPLRGRRVALGVSGSIAAYKAFEVARRLEDAGATVDVVLTEAGARFAPALTFRGLVGGTVADDMFEVSGERELHVAIARRADVMLVAPASATTIAKLAQGIADSMLSLTALAAPAPLIVAPAMDSQMYQHPATQANLETLRQRDALIIGPAEGRLASGQVGLGRMSEPVEIVGAVRAVLGRAHGDLGGRRVVVSAGGTREAIDPVRYVSNRSSGKMGFALAEAARDRGALVSLVTTESPPDGLFGVQVRHVESAAEMLKALQQATRGADALIMAAAVADFRPLTVAEQKIKKGALAEQGDGATLRLDLTETPDLLGALTGGFIRVGFKAESQDLVANATTMLHKKALDLVVANDISSADSGFGADNNRIVLIGRDGDPEALPLLPKYTVAQRILDRVGALLPTP